MANGDRVPFVPEGVVGAMFAIETEERFFDHDDSRHIGVIKIAFSDWPMPRELWRSHPFLNDEDASREAHDQLCDAFRFLLNSRENGASK